MSVRDCCRLPLLGNGTTGRVVWPHWLHYLFKLTFHVGWRAGPGQSQLAEIAGQSGQSVTKLLRPPTATVAGELPARELNDSSEDSLECPQ